MIADEKNCTVYEMKPETGGRTEPQTKETAETGGKQCISDTQMDSLEKELQRTGVGMDAANERYKIDSPENMSEETYRRVMSALAKIKPAEKSVSMNVSLNISSTAGKSVRILSVPQKIVTGF